MDEEEFESYNETAMERHRRILDEYKRENIDLADVRDELGIDPKRPMVEYNQTFGISYEDPITLWDILPFYETVVISLDVVGSHEEFKRRHGFSVDEINDVVELAKNGRIDLLLEAKPTTYIDAGMDYVEDLLEFKPAIKESGTVLEFIRLSHKYQDDMETAWSELQVALDTLDDLPFLSQNIREPNLSNTKRVYATLRHEYPEVAQKTFETIQQDPNPGLFALNMLEDFLLRPSSDPVADSIAWPRNIVDAYKSINEFQEVDPREVELPGELGAQILDELAPGSSNRWEALKLSDDLDSNDFHRYMREINDAIEKEREHDIDADREEIEEIIQSVRDQVASRGKRRERTARAALTIGFCAMGTAAGAVAGPAGSAVGFATSLGLSYVDQRVGDSLAERIIPARSPYSLTTFKVAGELEELT